MQQTEQYQFNLIENSDYLSPEPINDNMRRVDELFGGLTRVECFTYTGTGAVQRTFTFAAKPLALVLCGPTTDYGLAVAWRGMSYTRGTGMLNNSVFDLCASWEENSVKIYQRFNNNGAYVDGVFNQSGARYFVIVFLGELQTEA